MFAWFPIVSLIVRQLTSYRSKYSFRLCNLKFAKVFKLTTLAFHDFIPSINIPIFWMIKCAHDTTCTSVFLLSNKAHGSLHSWIWLNTTSTLVVGFHNKLSMNVSFAFNCPGERRLHDFFRKSKISWILYWIVYVIGFLKCHKYLLPTVSIICLRSATHAVWH